MNRIKFLREEFDMTQQELADKLNGAKSTVAMYEKGDRKPSLEILVKLSEVFNCSIDYLLCKTNTRNATVNIAKIPILGTVKAGYDWLAEENVVDYITLKENLPNIREYYALRITGDSMLPLLSEGDLVIVHDQDDVESGQTAVILINRRRSDCKKSSKNK